MIEFDVDMGYLLEAGELDCVILNDENGEREPMEFVPKLGSGTCELDYDHHCSNCGVCVHERAVLVRKKLDGGLWTVVSKPASFCPNCGRRVKR